MKATAKRALLIATGWGFIILGVVGMIVIHGSTFLIIGLIILSHEYVWADKLLKKVRARFPRIAAFVDRCQMRLSEWWARMWRAEVPEP